jgi:hypothetical protein
MKTLAEIFALIDKVPLKRSKYFMNERDYADMVGNPCPECGRMVSAFTDSSVFQDCSLCCVRSVMED